MPYQVPLIIRGKVIRDAGLTFDGRREGVRFSAPDVRRYLPELPLASPAAMSDHHRLAFDEVLDYLHALVRASRDYRSGMRRLRRVGEQLVVLLRRYQEASSRQGSRNVGLPPQAYGQKNEL